MQVGTSRFSSVSGGADYPFTLAQLGEYFLRSITPSTARIHLRCELDDRDQPLATPMRACRHQATYPREALEVESFSRQQRERLEVGDHAVEQVLESSRLPLQRPVAPIRPDASAPEMRLNQVEDLGAISVLTDGKAWPHLPAREQRRPRSDGNGEATFSVNVPGDVCREELATATGAGV